jgi:glycosyltransferase involved in cell wall biosynthesis
MQDLQGLPRVGETDGKPFVSVLIPAYREEEHIQATLKGIAEGFRAANLNCEIVVVVDIVPGDNTVSLVRKVAQAYHEVVLVDRPGRRGVGDAIRTGISKASGRVLIVVMGDQSEHPTDVVKLARRADHCDIVFTNRFKNGRPPGYPVLKYAANRCCNFAAMLLFHTHYSDSTNAFKAYRKEIVDQLELVSTGFEIFLELPIKALRLTDKTCEIVVSHTVKRDKTAKLSIIRDGYRYVRVLISLLTGNWLR